MKALGNSQATRVIEYEAILDEITEIKQEKGYVYAYPPKRSWASVDDSRASVLNAWEGGAYNGELGIYLHVPFCPPS